jgi:CRISPR-associated protein Csx1
MARIKALAEYLLKLTELGQEVSKGFDLNDMGQLMKFLHALQVQVLIVTAQRATSIGTPSWRRWRGGKFPRPEIPRPYPGVHSFIYSVLVISMGRGSVLVAAAWGYPPGWRKARYRVEPPQHPSFKGARPVECTSCSSTLALIRFFRENGWDVKTLIFGVDTALNPTGFTDGEEFRKSVKEQYLKWFRGLAETSNCTAELEPEVVVLPGIGRHWGCQFKGALLAVFNETLHALLKAGKPTFLVVDLTHGINFQTVAVLYAAVAAAVIWKKEKDLLILNSDPYPTGVRVEQCVSGEKTKESAEVPELSLNDVSELQRAVRNIRQIAALRRFQMPELEDVDLTDELRQLLAYICLLANGAAGLAFSGARYDDGSAVAQLPRVEVKPPDTTPIIRDETVEYPAPDRTYAVRTAIEAVVSDLHNLQRDNLVDFLNAVARHYEKIYSLQNAFILKQTAQEFGRVIERAKKLRLRNELTAAEVKALVELSEESINETEFRNRVESAQREIEEERTRLRDVAKRAEGNLDRWLRNLFAHGGLSYILIDKVELAEGKIVKVIYRRDLLQPLLDELMRQCNLESR